MESPTVETLVRLAEQLSEGNKRNWCAVSRRCGLRASVLRKRFESFMSIIFLKT